MHRYPSRNRFQFVMKSHRSRPFLVILLLILAGYLVFRLISGGNLDVANFESQRNTKLRSEMQHALSQTNSLSNLGAASTSGALGRIRQYVHGMEVINDLNVSMYGTVGRLYEQSTFDSIYTIIDGFDAKLSSGVKVNDSVAMLRSAMDELNNLTTMILEK